MGYDQEIRRVIKEEIRRAERFRTKINLQMKRDSRQEFHRLMRIFMEEVMEHSTPL